MSLCSEVDIIETLLREYKFVRNSILEIDQNE